MSIISPLKKEMIIICDRGVNYNYNDNHITIYKSIKSVCVHLKFLQCCMSKIFQLKNYNKTGIILLGVHLREMRIYVHAKTCAQMLIAALFVIGKNQKQPECSSVGE